MAKKNPRINAYISKALPFARPILKRLRKIIHKGCPKVTEEIKWHVPFYLYEDKILCATMGFKKHCTIIFWKSNLIAKKKGRKAKNDLKQMRRFRALDQLPSERTLLSYIKLAMRFNEPTTKTKSRKK